MRKTKCNTKTYWPTSISKGSLYWGRGSTAQWRFLRSAFCLAQQFLSHLCHCSPRNCKSLRPLSGLKNDCGLVGARNAGGLHRCGTNGGQRPAISSFSSARVDLFATCFHFRVQVLKFANKQHQCIRCHSEFSGLSAVLNSKDGMASVIGKVKPDVINVWRSFFFHTAFLFFSIRMLPSGAEVTPSRKDSFS